MNLLLIVAGGALGVVVPLLFAWALMRGIERSPFDVAVAASHKRTVKRVVGVWTLAGWLASLSGVVSYHEGDPFPRFLVPLLAPVAAGLVLMASRTFRTIVEHMPARTLVGVQTFRLAGVVFFVLTGLGILPGAFTSSGYGDLLTGVLAASAAVALGRRSRAGNVLFWSFNAVGVLDLLNVAWLLLAYYPSHYRAVPSSAPAFEFSLALLPILAAPMALLLHCHAILGSVLRRAGSSAHGAPANSGSLDAA